VRYSILIGCNIANATVIGAAVGLPVASLTSGISTGVLGWQAFDYFTKCPAEVPLESSYIVNK
jgi:hypothetical protein